MSLGRIRSYLLPWRLTRPAAAAAEATPPPHHYRRHRRHHWHHRGGIDCQLHARARLLQHTAFIHHTRSASSLRAGTTASQVYTYIISTVDRYNNIILYIAVVARDKQKLAVQYGNNCTVVVSFFRCSFPRRDLEWAGPKDNPPTEILLYY